VQRFLTRVDSVKSSPADSSQRTEKSILPGIQA
jgi:hypothetical protein